MLQLYQSWPTAGGRKINGEKARQGKSGNNEEEDSGVSEELIDGQWRSRERTAEIEEERELNAYQSGGRGTGGDDKKDSGDEGENWRDLDGKLREAAQGIDVRWCKRRRDMDMLHIKSIQLAAKLVAFIMKQSPKQDTVIFSISVVWKLAHGIMGNGWLLTDFFIKTMWICLAVL